jgi:hypothetical protein
MLVKATQRRYKSDGPILTNFSYIKSPVFVLHLFGIRLVGMSVNGRNERTRWRTCEYAFLTLEGSSTEACQCRPGIPCRKCSPLHNQNQMLIRMNNGAKVRRSTKSAVLGKGDGKVMSFEVIEVARAARAVKEVDCDGFSDVIEKTKLQALMKSGLDTNTAC